MASKASNAAVLDAAKTTTVKAAAAAIVVTMAANVALNTTAGFVAARLNAKDLEDLYGKLSANRIA